MAKAVRTSWDDNAPAAADNWNPTSVNGPQPRKLFDITQTIGSVFEDPSSPFTPNQVAFTMIADWVPTATDTPPSTFTFPAEDGNIIEVTIALRPATRHD